MTYAVPVSDGVVAAHFGPCEHFALIDADEERKRIASGMGSRARTLLQTISAKAG